MPELYDALEALRYHIGNKPVNVVSGYRCHTHNTKVGGAKNSQHMHGRAADIMVDGMSPKDVAVTASTYVPQLRNGGIGVYPTFTHIDVRGCYGMKRARWAVK